MRWVLAPTLDEYPESIDPLLTLLADEDADSWARLCAASTLGHLQHHAARPVLRATMDALAGGQMDGLWQLAGRSVVPRVASALNALGDEAWAQQRLLMLLDARPGLDDRWGAVLDALTHTDLNRVPGVLQRYLDEAVASGAVAPLLRISRLSCAALVPRLFTILDEGTANHLHTRSVLFQMIIDAIDNVSYVPRLLAHQQDNEYRAALEALAGRCQVRIFADGRIVDVKKSASGR